MAEHRVDAHFVLEHQGYVKRLARSLVFDETAADDLAQQVWLAALRRPPEHGLALRGWLSTIARNLAASARVQGARSEQRERAVARHEAVGAADELIVREQLRARLVEAVLALDEPFREALILRYFDELSPRAIAARQGVPVATVKSRLKRGLAALRERLDREGGGRVAWSLALLHGLRVEPSTASLAAFSVKSIASGVVLMTTAKKLSVAVCVLLACLVTWRVATPSRESEAVAPPSTPALGAVAAEDTQKLAAPAAAPGERKTLPSLFPWRAKPTEPKTGPGALDVTVLAMPGRRPVVDCEVLVRPILNSESTLLHGVTARTDAQGVAHFEDLEPGAFGIDCDRAFEPMGMPAASAGVQAGERRQLSLLIEDASSISGLVVDTAGQPVAGAQICLEPRSTRNESFAVTRSGDDGRFEIRDVNANSVYVFAKKSGFVPSSPQFNMTIAGGILEVVLALRGPAGVLHGSVRDPDGAPVPNALVIAGSRGSTTYLHDDGRRITLPDASTSRTDGLGRFEFDGLLAGASDIHVHAQGFVDFNATLEVRSAEATQQDVQLSRGTQLSGSVRCEGGKPAAFADLSVRSPASGVVRNTRADEHGAYSLSGLEPGLVRVSAKLQGLESTQEELLLEAGAAAIWNPTLSAGRELAVRVLDASGKPAKRITVELLREVPGEERFAASQSKPRDGLYRMPGCRDVDYVVRVFPEDSRLFAIAEVRGVRPGPEPLVVTLDPSLRPSIYISGRVVGAQGQALGAIKLTPYCAEHDYNAMQLTASDGSFRAGPFPPGRWGLSIDAPDHAAFAMPERELVAGQKLDLGTIRLERGDAIDVRLIYPDDPPSPRLYALAKGLDQPIEVWCKVESGHARTPPLPPGRYRLSFEGAYAACVLDAEVVAGSETSVDLALQPGIAFRIQLDDQTQDPTAMPRLLLRDGEGTALLERTPWPKHVEPFDFPVCLAPGHYRIEASDSAGRKSSHEFQVDASSAGQIVTITLR